MTMPFGMIDDEKKKSRRKDLFAAMRLDEDGAGRVGPTRAKQKFLISRMNIDGEWPDDKRDRQLRGLAEVAKEFTPIGDVEALGRVYDDVKGRKATWLGTGLDALSVVPVIGALGDARRAGKAAAKAADAPRSIDPSIPDVKFNSRVVESADDEITGKFLGGRAKSSRGAYLSPLERNDLVGKRVALNEDGNVGYAISPEGDLQNVFNAGGPKGAGRAAVNDAIGQGAKTLDAFDGHLPEMYKKHGFEETSRTPFNDEFAPEGWNFDKDKRPDVVFMGRPGVTPSEPMAGRVFSEYDDAKKVQQAAMGAKTPSELSMALQGVIMGKKGPATILKPADAFKRTYRGIFDPDAPKIQGTRQSDPRLLVGSAAGPGQYTSPMVDAMLGSKQVRQGMDAQASKGLHMGGPEWYELGGLEQLIKETEGAMPLREWNSTGAAASANNSIPNEFSGQSIVNYARKRGISLDEAKQHYKKAIGNAGVNPALMSSHMDTGVRGIQEGLILPADLASDAYKLPSYENMRNGGGGALDLSVAGNTSALDTHERRALMQLIAGDPQLARFAKDLGITTGEHSDVLATRNALDYRDVNELYVEGAKRFGLPTSGAYQASRWTGGWDKTGLQSPPNGTYEQLLEDAVAFTAQSRNMPSDPASLRKYMQRVLRGDEFILPWNRGGGYPVK